MENLPRAIKVFNQIDNITTKVLIITICFFSFPSLFWDDFRSSFVLVPAEDISHLHLWTFITAGFVDDAPLVIIGLLVSFAFGTFLSHSWTNSEQFAFIFAISSGTQLAILVGSLILQFFVSAPIAKDSTGIGPIIRGSYRESYGLCPLIAAYSVVIKQKIPEKPLFSRTLTTLFPRGKHIPLLVLVLSLLTNQKIATFCGFFGSWFYLRYYRQYDHGYKGDMREDFAFAKFFPSFIQPYLSKAFNKAHKLGVQMKIVPTRAQLPTFTAPFTPALDPAAERRRQLAIQAIDKKLAALAMPSEPLPDLSEPATPTSSDIPTVIEVDDIPPAVETDTPQE